MPAPAAPAREPGALPGWAFPAVAGAALGLHAVRLGASPGLHGGGDLLPHLRLIELMAQEPALRNVLAPGYHVLGALVAPLVGLAAYPKLFAVAAAALSLVAFRAFQRSAGLPDAVAILFVLWPYHFTLSWSLPKVEVAGYAGVYLALATLLRRRYGLLALLVGGSFWLHTASALLLGLSCGVLALARRDGRALGALALGTLGALPLLGAHLAAGCSLQQALLFGEGDYLHVATHRHSFHRWPLILALASPPILVAALFGAPATWRRWRAVAVLCAASLALYLQELWLAPFQMSTTVTLDRGLSVLALPACVAAGVLAATRPRLAPWLLLGAGLWCGTAAVTLAPRLLYWRPVALQEIRDLRLVRCRLGWIAPHSADRKLRAPRPAPANP